MMQLDFFHKDEKDLLLDEIQRLRESGDKMRKALFARHGELAKNYLNLQERLDVIERNICRGN